MPTDKKQQHKICAKHGDQQPFSYFVIAKDRLALYNKQANQFQQEFNMPCLGKLLPHQRPLFS